MGHVGFENQRRSQPLAAGQHTVIDGVEQRARSRDIAMAKRLEKFVGCLSVSFENAYGIHGSRGIDSATPLRSGGNRSTHDSVGSSGSLPIPTASIPPDLAAGLADEVEAAGVLLSSS